MQSFTDACVRACACCVQKADGESVKGCSEETICF